MIAENGEDTVFALQFFQRRHLRADGFHLVITDISGQQNDIWLQSIYFLHQLFNSFRRNRPVNMQIAELNQRIFPFQSGRGKRYFFNGGELNAFIQRIKTQQKRQCDRIEVCQVQHSDIGRVQSGSIRRFNQFCRFIGKEPQKVAQQQQNQQEKNYPEQKIADIGNIGKKAGIPPSGRTDNRNDDRSKPSRHNKQGNQNLINRPHFRIADQGFD